MRPFPFLSTSQPHSGSRRARTVRLPRWIESGHWFKSGSLSRPEAGLFRGAFSGPEITLQGLTGPGTEERPDEFGVPLRSRAVDRWWSPGEEYPPRFVHASRPTGRRGQTRGGARPIEDGESVRSRQKQRRDGASDPPDRADGRRGAAGVWMMQFLECRGCGFVLRGRPDGDGEPLYWDRCPDCAGSEFEAVGE